MKEPSRKIPKNYRNITGKFSSEKSDRLISYESKLERDFLYLFEFENIVLRILEQPVTIKYSLEDKRYKYTPDFYLETPVGRNNIIVEVKYYDELKKNFNELKPKFTALIEYIKGKDIDFYILTDRCPYIQSDDYKFNVHFLLNYRLVSQDNYEIVKEIFTPYITVQELLEQYSDDKYKQLDFINIIWSMIRRKILLVDMYQKLGLQTRLVNLRDYKEDAYKAHLEGRVLKGYLI